MKIASLFGHRVLEPAWTYAPNANIWRLLPTDSGEFIGEARDQDKKQVSFFALKSETGAVLWQNLTLTEPWWVGIEDSADNVVLLHKFASPDLPQHRGMIALDLLSGRELWENQDLMFWFIRSGSVFGLKTLFEKRIVLELDLHTGNVKKEHDQETDLSSVRSNIQDASADNRGLTFPEVLDMKTFESPASRLLRRELPLEDLVGDVEFLMTKEFLAANYHVRSAKSGEKHSLLDNCFKILEVNNGKTVYEDVIARGSPGVVPDSFFLRSDTFFFIKDQRILTAIKPAR